MMKMKKWVPGFLAAAVTAVLICTSASYSAQAAEIHVNTLSGVEQVVLVETSSASSSYATVTAYEETSEGTWVSQNTTTEGRVGSNGIVPIASRKQSTNTTPEGVLRLLEAYGIADDPGSLFTYHKITSSMYWDLNSGSSTYNQLVYSNPGGDYEHLIDYTTTYQYLFTTDYTIEQIANKGGAIFFHCNGSGATGGCVSVPKTNMVWYMQWLDPDKNPSLIVTTTADKSTYFVPEAAALTGITYEEGVGVTISWKLADGAAKYEIQRADSSGTYTTVTTLSSSATSWTDPDGSKTDTYRVVTRNVIDGEDGYSAVSGTFSAAVPFTDVSESAYYYDAVAWAVENGVTAGTSATTFSPNLSCTRAEIVQFMWNGEGNSAIDETLENPFEDVSDTAWYYNAVQWAVQNDVTAGTSDTTFSPNATCSRAQIVTLLWKYMGMPEPSDDAPTFDDVSPEDYYYTAVRWAAEQGITAGTGNGCFSPGTACTRAQAVMFLSHIF